MPFFYEGTPRQRIDAQIEESRGIHELSAKPELLEKKVRWIPHAHGPRPTEDCKRNEAIITSVIISGPRHLWVPEGTVLIGIQCIGCAEGTTVVDTDVEYLFEDS